MDNMLNDCEPISVKDSERRSSTSDDFDKDIESAANELEENLLGLFETAPSNDNDLKASGSNTDDDHHMKLDDNPFDGDIILPTVHSAPDPCIEQKQRDRAKRKELRNKREAEEEEREKMQ